MKQASFRKRIGVGVGLSAISVLFQFLSFCVNNLLGHALGPGAFADYNLLNADFLLFSIAADFGTGALVLSFFAGRLHLPYIARTVFRMRFGLAAAAAAAMVLFEQLFRAGQGLAFPGALFALGLLCSPGTVEWFFLGTRDWRNLVRFKLVHAGTYLLGAAALATFGFSDLDAVCLTVACAPLPAFLFALRRLPRGKPVRRGSARRFLAVVLRAACPYALSAAASFAYLPAILWAVNLAWPGDEERAAFFASHKIVFLLQTFALQFLASEQIFSRRGLDPGAAGKLKRCADYALLSLAGVLPLALLGSWTPRLLFFGLDWTPEMAAVSDQAMRVLPASIVLQFARLPALAQLLADRRIVLNALITAAGGLLNVGALVLAARTAPEWIPVAGLSGDLLATALTVGAHLRRRAADGPASPQMLS
ncbi:MAG: hypothetical protein J6Z50_06935 [Fibrobacterales bacterium]|nr:hypothetical protein [Fibrobacterales bacterium]